MDEKEPENYEFKDGTIPMQVTLRDSEYDGVMIVQDGEYLLLPPSIVLWLGARVRDYYPDVKEFDPCTTAKG